MGEKSHHSVETKESIWILKECSGMDVSIEIENSKVFLSFGLKTKETEKTAVKVKGCR